MSYEAKQILLIYSLIFICMGLSYLGSYLDPKIKRCFLQVRKYVALFIAWIWYPAIYKEYSNEQK